MDSPVCPYCSQTSELVDSMVIYPHARQSYGWMYLCRPCWAYVGCHNGGTRSKGRLANEDLREAKKHAHKYFDRIWKEGHMPRTRAYSWLSRELGLSKDDTHIGMFGVKNCLRTADACIQYLERKNG
jgi:hypothetical protein